MASFIKFDQIAKKVNNKNLLANLSLGVQKDEIRAIIHVIGIYCGVPQALECFRVAKKKYSKKKIFNESASFYRETDFRISINAIASS